MWAFSTALAADPWQRPINDAFQHADHVWIGPFPDTLQALKTKFGGTVADTLPDAGVPYLYGDPSSNPDMAEVLAWHGISLDAEGVTFGASRVPAVDPFLIVALPRPGRPSEPVVVYTAFTVDIQPKLNSVFHGPTSVVVGQREADGDLEKLYAGSFEVDPDGRVKSLSLAPARLASAEAVEDLDVLVDQLRAGYAGLADFDGWDTRVNAARDAFGARESWTWTEVWDALVALLEPVRDSHFSMRGAALTEDGPPVSRQARLTVTQRVWFADGRLTGTDGRWTWDGAPLSEAPPSVPAPADVVPGTTYRFPTLLADGAPAWLVGVFATEPPPPIRVGDHEVAVHAARVTRRSKAAPWTLDAGEVPVLSVTTMVTERLEGLQQTPDTLRTAERVVLDLRGNGGGSDDPAREWVTTFAPRRYRWHGGADLTDGPGPQADRFAQWRPATFGRPGRPRWRGDLVVLIDGNVASSGETFTMLGSQVPGAQLVGVNTFGCTRFGNVSEHPPLPNSRIAATFGHTRFDFADVIPVAEGLGIFPDLWLDEEDPVAFLRALP